MSKISLKVSPWFYLLAIAVISLSSCNTTKFLDEDERLLIKNEFDFTEDHDVEKKSSLEYELERLAIQRPNGKFFGVNRAWFYYVNSKPGDTSWYQNYLRETVGEPPSIFDPYSAKISAQNMQSYLINKKGYYHAEVDFESEKTETLAKVEYKVKPGDRYRVGTVTYIGKDEKTLDLIRSLSSESLITPGTPIDEATFTSEKSRITNALQNRGYANFFNNYINILGDSTNQNNTVNIFLELLAPSPDSVHHVYEVGDIHVYTDYTLNQHDTLYSSEKIDGIYFHSSQSQYLVRPGILKNKIFLKPGKLYTKESRNKTFRKLSSLSTYSFVTINPVVREDSYVIDYDIYLTPHRYAWSAEYGSDVFYATLNQSLETRNRLLGVSVNSQFKNKNLLGGSEEYTINAETGAEVDISPPVSLRTLSFGLDNALKFPEQVDVFGFARAMRIFGVLGGDRYHRFKEETETTINAGFTHIDISNFYAISSVRGNYSYTYQPKTSTKFIIRQVGLDLNIYNIKEGFQDELNNNPLLAFSFQNNLLTGFLFRDISYIYSEPQKGRPFRNAVIFNFEMSGWETYLTNQAYNLVTGSDEVWKLSENVEFSKYFRTNIDFRHYRHFTKNSTLASRAYAGIIIPYGSQQVAPFVRQFSVGGPNSMRAWDQKELGPGGYDSRPEYERNAGIPYYQQGDLRLEFNLEYRQDLFWLVEGALFVDAGNVWNLKSDPNRPFTKISSNFYEEIAIGIGYGIRFDFDYFNIRFDFGYKIRNPYHIEGASNWSSWEDIKSQGLGNFQVAVNYPF